MFLQFIIGSTATVGLAAVCFFAGYINWHTDPRDEFSTPLQWCSIPMWGAEGKTMVFGWVLTACLLIELIMGLNEGSVVSDGHGFFFLQPLWEVALFAGVAILVGVVSTAAFYFGDRAGFRVANRYSVRPYR